ncbi:MAG: DUF1538 domain-containing protein [Burkholderiales bacterium]|nr:DUF1538 domain-containing protein [Burkholderiales bacterium]
MTASQLLAQFGETAWSVLVAVLPLAVLFMLFQILFLQLPAREVARILAGTLMAAAGLFLFLLGVSIGFLPFGEAVGRALGALEQEWLVLLSGILLGFVTTWGEPAVRILAGQVDEASSGSIRRSLVLVAVCAGVALAVGAGLLRISHDIALLYLVVPGYATVLALMWFCDKQFVGIAIDAGGVATGPLANTFLLALAFGAASAAGGGNALTSGLGLVALIALAPVMSVMALGLVIRLKERRKEA